MNPLVSVIIPSYNTSDTLKYAIESIINQTYDSFEILITDDNSKQEHYSSLVTLANQYSQVKLFRLEENSGPAVARNRSIRQAEGRFIAFLDADDLWEPTKLEEQVKFMLENDIALSYTSYSTVDEQGHNLGRLVQCPSKVSYHKMLKNNYIGCLTAMYDREKLGKIYMPEIKKRQDWALWLSILKTTPYALGIQKPLAKYRVRENSVSRNKFNLIKYNWKIYNEVEGFSAIKSMFYMIRFFFFYFLKKVN